MKKILIINNASDPKDMDFVDFFNNYIDKPKIIHFSRISKDILKQSDKIILSGCSIDEKNIIKRGPHYYHWLKTIKKPVLGVCAGHQIIGKIFGAKIIHEKEKETGHYKLHMDKRCPLFKGLKTDFKVFEFHKDSIKIPKDFILLAHSNKCKVEAMKHKSKPIYGIQFHIHKSPSGKHIIKNFVELVK